MLVYQRVAHAQAIWSQGCVSGKVVVMKTSENNIRIIRSGNQNEQVTLWLFVT